MIRRDFELPSGQPAWILISQPEHARISGAAARRLDGFPSSGADAAAVLAAVDHHDAGWAGWIDRPQLDANGQPLTFMEMELADSLAIWSASIQAAAAYGPLAAWIAAGHFQMLLAASQSHAADPAAQAWLAEIGARRGNWLTRWGGDPDFAACGLAWLRVLDAVSLWLCCHCPAQGERARETRPFRMSMAGVEVQLRAPEPGEVFVGQPGLRGHEMGVVANGLVAPAARYQTPDDLLDACTRCQLQWRLIGAGGSGGASVTSPART